MGAAHSSPASALGEGGASRPRIGLVINGVEAEYQWGMVEAALASAESSGARLYVFAAGVVAPPGAGALPDNALFDLVTPASLDAVVLVSSTMGHALGPEGLAEWAHRFDPLPVASIGIDVPGRPSFLVENESGTLRATLHLAQHHGYRRIAFVEGAAGSREAEARRRGYERGLLEAGLELDPRLIVPGDYTVVAGQSAVARWFDQERVRLGTLNAILTANDAMAFGVIEELHRRGVEVPGQVAVIGFDDVMIARVGPPPLTSVRQPIERLAAASIRAVLGAVRGTPEPGGVLDTELVVRRSCGCLVSAAPVGATGGGLRSASEVAVLAHREQITAVLARAARGRMVGAGSGWEQRLLLAAVEDARGGGAHLVGATDDILARLTRAGTDPSVLDDVLSTLRAEVNAVLEPGAASRQIEDAFHDARRTLSDQVLRRRIHERAELTFGMQNLVSLARLLRAPPGAEDATAEFVRQVRALGCDAGLVASLDADRRTARTVIHYDRSGAKPPQVFPAERLWPGEEPDSAASGVVVHPIVDQGRLIGFCAFAIGAMDGSLHELLREIVTTRLRSGAAPHPLGPADG